MDLNSEFKKNIIQGESYRRALAYRIVDNLTASRQKHLNLNRKQMRRLIFCNDNISL